MKETRLLMGMPITVQINDRARKRAHIDGVYEYFTSIDERFSLYKPMSEISRFNRKEVKENELSKEMKEVFTLCEKTKKETNGYFDIDNNGICDPSGLVKGWAIYNAAKLLQKMKLHNFFIDAGGDIQTAGKNKEGEKWRIGIRNPFNREENVKVLALTDKGVATSGTYIRGAHIYNPKKTRSLDFARDDVIEIEEIVSLTVIGPNIYEADRFATAAFAMGRIGIEFIENLPEFEGYMIDRNGIGTETSGFKKYAIR